MKVRERSNAFFKKYFSMDRLIPVALTLVIVWLLSATGEIWGDIYRKIITILLPFVLGFGLAYLIRPMVVFLEKKGVKRQFGVLIVMTLFVAGIVLLFSSIIPSLMDDFGKFFNSISQGVTSLYDYYIKGNSDPSPLIEDLYTQLSGIVTKTLNQLSNVPMLASSFIGNFVGMLTTLLFSFIIGIYFIFDYENFTKAVHRIAEGISPKLSSSITVVDTAVSGYLKTLLILMGITFVEYTIMYSILGHNYAIVLGILTALSLLIPYIGPTIVNTIGVLTALALLPFEKVIILLILIMIMSNVDGYVISPIVYAKRDKIQPLWSLFAMFACSTLFGFTGILLSMPIYFSIRAIYKLWKNNWTISEENNV